MRWHGGKGSTRRPLSVSHDEFSDNWDAIFQRRKDITFIYNPRLSHQCDHAEAMAKAGCKITTDRAARGAITIVSGPHYCSELLRSPVAGLYMIDRSYWLDPDYVALYGLSGGLRVYGEPVEGIDKYAPDLEPYKDRRQTALVLLDYSQSPDCEVVKEARRLFEHVRVRPHPAMEPTSPVESLESAVMLSDVVIGGASTALIKAAIWGKPIHCTYPQSAAYGISVPMEKLKEPTPDHRKEWLEKIKWHCFSLDEISEGVAFMALGI